MGSKYRNSLELNTIRIGAAMPSFLATLEGRTPLLIQFDVRAVRAASKRCIDIGGALLLLLCFAPVLLGILVAILSERDGGAVLFRQTRIGQYGRPFTCIKFRSMCCNADAALELLLADNQQARLEWDETRKLKNDPRITRIGKFLRSSSLDELPQLWNVLIGDMSRVGPRPITQAEIEGPYTLFEGRQLYLAVRPGLTGLWQVNGRSDVSYESRVNFDKIYVRDLSLFRDASILWQTIGVVLRRSGAC